MAKPKYWTGCILTTKLGTTFTITDIKEVEHGNSSRLCYFLEGHGRRHLAVDYIDSSEHLTCINLTKAGKVLHGR